MKKDFLKSITIDKWIMILAAGIFLIFLSFTSGNTKLQSDEAKNTETTSEDAEVINENMQLSQYQEALEKKLMETLQNVEGVGTVKVMITLKTSSERVVNKDETSETRTSNTESNVSSEKTTVLTDNGQSPYVLKEIMPEIEGVAVVAQGGGDAVIKNEIYDAIQALFNISVHKIKVLKGNF